MTQKSQFDNLKYNAIIEKERKNEYKYFRKFKDLLQAKKSVILSKAIPVPVKAPTSEDDDDHGKKQQQQTSNNLLHHYQKETKIIQKILAAEREAIIGSVVVGSMAFVSVRILPRIVIRGLGGERKMKSLRDAELKARTGPNGFLKRSGTFLFEGMFGFWAGWRGYHMGLSMQTQDMVEEITKIPLVEGRSVISDELCHDLTTLIHDEIPSIFWKNLDKSRNKKDNYNYEEGLKHEDTWRNIIKFCDNCLKRKKYEEMIIRQNKDSRQAVSITTTTSSSTKNDGDNKHVVIPSPGVPEDIKIEKKLSW